MPLNKETKPNLFYPIIEKFALFDPNVNETSNLVLCEILKYKFLQ